MSPHAQMTAVGDQPLRLLQKLKTQPPKRRNRVRRPPKRKPKRNFRTRPEKRTLLYVASAGSKRNFKTHQNVTTI